jgi:threonine dehydratase
MFAGAYYALRRHAGERNVAEVVAASTGTTVRRSPGRKAGAGHCSAGVRAGWSERQKLDRIEALGAEIVPVTHEEWWQAMVDRGREGVDGFFVHPVVDEAVMAGNGTIGLELLEQLADFETLYVPVGDSALIRGVAAAVKAQRPGVRVVGVQAEGAPAYYRSWQSGEVVNTPTANTIADGLATTRPTEANVVAVRELVDEMVLVTEQAMRDAMQLLLTSDDVVAEPAAAASVAALLEAPRVHSGPVVALITGRNVRRSSLCHPERSEDDKLGLTPRGGCYEALDSLCRRGHAVRVRRCVGAGQGRCGHLERVGHDA